MAREQVNSKELVSLSLRLGDGLKALQLDEGSAALSVAAVEEGGDAHQGVNVLGLQLLFVLNESHGGLHRTVIILLVELSLTQQVEVDGFCSLPRVGQGLVRGSANIRSDQRSHCTGRDVGSSLASASDLGDLSVEHSLLERVHLEGGQDVNLFDEERRSVLLAELLGDSGEDLGRLCVLVGLSEELDSLHLFVLLDEVVGILLKKLLDLQEVMLLSKLDSHVPLVQQNTAIDGLLDVPELQVGLGGSLAQSHRLEAFSDVLQNRVVIRKDTQ
mmetsp:Transcript_36640/g.56203  ORF Transcript_36640/g.56203 Transcript_36640/m.56203 type:complete len:273 (+) Transcript_36640:327-1145(+)